MLRNPECGFTVVKDSHSCKGCRYSLHPSDYDGVCLLPSPYREQALKGKRITIPPEVEREIQAQARKRGRNIM